MSHRGWLDSDGWYRRQVPTLLGVLVSLLVLVAILFAACSPKGITAPVPSPSNSGASQGIDTQASPVSAVVRTTSGASATIEVQAKLVQRSTRSIDCTYEWEWAPSGWGVKQLSGAWWYAFSTKIDWCVNSAKTKITGLAVNRCINLGGYWNFDWCTHKHSAPGYASMDVYPEWEYYLPKTGISRHPHIDATIYPNGVIKGTVYSDAAVICTYPAGDDCHS